MGGDREALPGAETDPHWRRRPHGRLARSVRSCYALNSPVAAACSRALVCNSECPLRCWQWLMPTAVHHRQSAVLHPDQPRFLEEGQYPSIVALRTPSVAPTDS